MKSEKVYIGKSKTGKGIFAAQPIKAGQVIVEITGRYLSYDECKNLGADECYPIQIDNISETNCYIFPDAPIYYLNHSCSGNSFIYNQKLFALKDIQPHSEITFDYSLSLSENRWTLEGCECDSGKSCRGSITDFSLLDEKLKELYINHGLVPDFILNTLPRPQINLLNKYFVGVNHLGKAVFAKDKIRKGEIILEFSGNRYHSAQLQMLESDALHYFMQIGIDTWIGPSNRADDWVNHSCQPNAGIVMTNGSIYFVAIKSIHAGQEIAWDYSTTSFNNLNMECKCGSKKFCRGVISNYASIPKNQKDYYLMLGIIPDFLIGI